MYLSSLKANHFRIKSKANLFNVTIFNIVQEKTLGDKKLTFNTFFFLRLF